MSEHTCHWPGQMERKPVPEAWVHITHGQGDVLYTCEEVEQAMELLRHHGSAIPSECLDQMERVLFAAASQLDNVEVEL